MRFFILLFLGLCAVASAAVALSFSRQSRLSAVVAFVPERPELLAFLSKPNVAYFQGYLRFPAGMADDVIMFLDIEMLEGIHKPLWVRGGDWMAFVGIQRTGAVWVAGGTDSTMKGQPSTERAWAIRMLDQTLKPDTWYRVRVTADFGQRRYVSFEIEGADLSQTLDLSDQTLDYPNYMPFDRGGLIVIPGAMRGRDMMKERGDPVVYFDDIEGGLVEPDGLLKPLYQDGFEKQTELGAQPVTLPMIDLDKYTFAHWYKEREEAIVSIVKKDFAKSGHSVGLVNADLEDP